MPRFVLRTCLGIKAKDLFKGTDSSYLGPGGVPQENDRFSRMERAAITGDGSILNPMPPGWNSNWEWRCPEARSNASARWFDPNGGEWRWHAPDKWHAVGHWDYNPWTSWNSAWQNIYP